MRVFEICETGRPLATVPSDKLDTGARLAIDHAIAATLAEAETLEEAAAGVLEAIGEGVGWHAASLWAVLPDADMLGCVATWSSPQTTGPGFSELSKTIRFARGLGLPGTAWETAEPQWVADVTKEPNFPRAHAAADVGLHAGMAVPLSSGTAIVGVLELFNREVLENDAGLIDLVGKVASQIGSYLPRKEAEAALRRSEELKGGLLESAFDCIIGMNHEGRIIEFNPAAEKTFGYERGSVIGAELAELIIPPQLRDRHRRALKRYLQTEEGLIIGRRIELTGMRADGSVFPVEVAVNRLEDAEPPAFSAYLRDITDRRLAEERAERIAAIIDSASDAIVAIEPDGTIMTWNRGAERIYGYTAEEAIGQPLSLIVPPEAIDQMDEMQERLRRGQPVKDHETVRLRKDGRRVHISLSHAPIHDAIGNFVGSAGIAREISEQKATEISLRFLADASAALDESLDLDLTLQKVASLSVPFLGDGCMVDLIDDSGELRRVGAATVDPGLKPVLLRLQGHRINPHGPHPIAKAARTGELQVVERFNDEYKRKIAEGDEGYLSTLLEWPAQSAAVTPLKARGRILGTIALAWFTSDREFSEADLNVIQELGRRASIAVDNARLYSELARSTKRSP